MSASIRPPAVAGTFYPGDAAHLATQVAALLAPLAPAPGPCPKAIIAPHAGYIYSGPTAARVYATLAPWRTTIRRVILLGPTHRVAVRGLAVPAADAFATPLGIIPIDRAARASLAHLPQVVVSDHVHALEHSLEVHLPFLQTVLAEFQLLPLAVGEASPAAVAEVIECLWGGAETLIVVSTDLSHFLSYGAARDIDDATCRQILALDGTLLPEQACGAYPVNGLLLAARRGGLEPELLDLCNSGDTAGDRNRVVGYAAFAFHPSEPASHA